MAIKTRESRYQCERAKNASSTQKTRVKISILFRLGNLFPHASQSAEKSDPKPKADEMKPKPAGPTCKTSFAKSGKTTLKLMPKSETTPMTAIMSNAAGVWAI